MVCINVVIISIEIDYYRKDFLIDIDIEMLIWFLLNYDIFIRNIENIYI